MKRLLLILIALSSVLQQASRQALCLAQTKMSHISVRYYNEQGEVKTGELVCNPSIAHDLTEIFAELFKAKYRFTSIRPISEFTNDDELSMSANNTSCYCYRKVKGQQRLSKHAQGLAIDINPLYNPCVKGATGSNSSRGSKGSRVSVQPANGAQYAFKREGHPMMIHKGDIVYKQFIAHGFHWGGAWRRTKDYQHFEK